MKKLLSLSLSGLILLASCQRDDEQPNTTTPAENSGLLDLPNTPFN